MTPRATILNLALLLLLGGCTREPGAQSQQPQPEQPRARQRMDTLVPFHHFVSYYKLLARPEEYQGKRVQVMGVLRISSEENIASLYPNAESFRYQVVVDSLSIELTDEQWRRFTALNGKFVAIEGTFGRITEADEYAAAGTIAPVARLGDFSEYHR
jgi:hypothetical protein